MHNNLASELELAGRSHVIIIGAIISWLCKVGAVGQFTVTFVYYYCSHFHRGGKGQFGEESRVVLYWLNRLQSFLDYANWHRYLRPYIKGDR